MKRYSLFIVFIILLFSGNSCSVKNEFYYKLAVDKINERKWNDSVNIKVSDQKCFCRKYDFYRIYIGFMNDEELRKRDSINYQKFKVDPNNIHTDLVFSNKRQEHYNYLMFLSDIKKDTLCAEVSPYDKKRKETYGDYAITNNYSYAYLFIFQNKKIKRLVVTNMGYWSDQNW